MNKIIRLSWANIKKHKLESIALLILVTLCMMLMGSSLAGIKGIKNIFPYVMENTESYENFLILSDKYYDNEFESILGEDERVEEIIRSDMLSSMSTNYLDSAGREQAMYMGFITEENDKKFEKTNIESKLSQEERDALEHPVIMPYALRDSMGYKENDKFEMVYGTRKFTFTVAGFYDTLLMDNPGGGVKMIVSENDYNVLQGILEKYVILAFNDHKGEGGYELFDDFIERCKEQTGIDATNGVSGIAYKAMEEGVTAYAEALLKTLIEMAAVIIVSIIIMIRFRVAEDIKQQIVSIGVLEALGYRSGDITLSYVAEYLMVALAGVILGTGCCFAVTPALLRIGEIVSGHCGSGSISFAPLLLTAAAILAFIALIAFIRARMVRKYPPVTALRKGIGDHRYGREHLQLKNTKSSVHLRLAMKGFLKNFRQNLGLTLCITLASSAIVLCFVIFSFFGNDMNAISNAAGIELSDLRVEIMETGDAYAFAEELADMPEVRKTVPTAGLTLTLTEPDYLDYMFPVALSDFSSAENIFPAEGRFPEHDNEVMITKMYAKLRDLKTGDSIPLECNNVRKNYVITGLVTSLTNGGGNLYITDDGMKRIMPTYRPDTIELYLNEGVDKDKFKYALTEKYGRSIADVAQDSSEGGSYEERIKAEAEQKIADLMANYGVSHVEYVIQSGDTVIKGSSDNFIIRSIMDIGSILRTQLGGTAIAIAILTTLFMVLSAFVVMVILFILMESNVRRQRKEFGIMKSMGYTSRELMFQLAARIMPAAIFSVAAGTVAAVMIIKYFTGYIGKISINIPAVIILDVILLLFCFGCAYVGARKIKKISVCELMSE